MFSNVIGVVTHKSETRLVLRSFKFNRNFCKSKKELFKAKILVLLFHNLYFIFPCASYSCCLLPQCYLFMVGEIVLNYNSYLYALVHRIQVFTIIFPLNLILDSSLFDAHINELFISLLLPQTIKNLTMKEQLSHLYEKLYFQIPIYI